MKETFELLFWSLLLSSFWCFGFAAIIDKLFLTTIFSFDIDMLWEQLPRWQKIIFKPLFSCPACMGSIHGTVIFFTLLFSSFGLIWWIPFCVMLCGLNYIISLIAVYE